MKANLKLACVWFFLSLAIPAEAIPPATLERLAGLYPDQTRFMIRKRIELAGGSFGLWRSFPPYFHQLVDRNRARVGPAFFVRRGLCAGDAHFENFGYLHLGAPRLTLNDLDDVAPCALDVDALRLYMGHRLIVKVNATEWLKSYQQGFSGAQAAAPPSFRRFHEESLSGGKKLPKKFKQLLATHACQDDLHPLTPQETKALLDFLLPRRKILLHGCSRLKGTGGSAGLKRIVYLQQDHGKLEAFELKPLVKPAPWYALRIDRKARDHVMNAAIETFLGESALQDYGVVSFLGQSHLLRPLLAGNVEINLKHLSPKEVSKVALYQAQVLGQLHALTAETSMKIHPAAWERAADHLAGQWEGEFHE